MARLVRARTRVCERQACRRDPDDLFAALLATLPPREDRKLEAPLFPDLTDARLRVAITRACRATGTPHFSPHGLRRRRGSLHYKRTGSLTEVAELLGDSKRVAADHYVYALTTTGRSTSRWRSPASGPEKDGNVDVGYSAGSTIHLPLMPCVCSTSSASSSSSKD